MPRIAGRVGGPNSEDPTSFGRGRDNSSIFRPRAGDDASGRAGRSPASAPSPIPSPSRDTRRALRVDPYGHQHRTGADLAAVTDVLVAGISTAPGTLPKYETSETSGLKAAVVGRSNNVEMTSKFGAG